MRSHARWIAACVVVLGLISMPSRAEAAPIVIGEFSWTEDSLFGPIFSITNFSDVSLPTGITFLGATVTTDADPAFDTVEVFGDVAPGSFGLQSFGVFLLPTMATLTFTPSLPGTIFVAPLNGPVIAGQSIVTSSEFTPAPAPPPVPVPVPEPGTLLLFGAGLAVVLARRRRS